MNAVPFVTPPVQLKLVAPVPVKITAVPAHTVDALVVELTVGNVFTVIVFVDVPIHPFASVPVTV